MFETWMPDALDKLRQSERPKERPTVEGPSIEPLPPGGIPGEAYKSPNSANDSTEGGPRGVVIIDLNG